MMVGSSNDFNNFDQTPTSDKGAKKRKAAYRAPSLVVFGSVKDLTAGGGMTTADNANNQQPSDPTLKENIVQIGEHPAGFGLYLFDYKPEFRDTCGHGRQFGVMADEVARIVPEAVVVTESGYRAVNYAMIGVTQH